MPTIKRAGAFHIIQGGAQFFQLKIRKDLQVQFLRVRQSDLGLDPGALNIPHDEVRAKAPEMLPDKNAFIVVYCANTPCQNSKIAANTLQQMGYINAYEYVEGKQHWLEANFPIESSR